MPSTRQLAAILFSDIVGYTALMGKDSKRARELVRMSVGIQKLLVEKHHGKWLKEMGDGAMAQFSSALDAVQCAIDIQEEARAKLDAKLRIGIHLGDITIENDDIYGDGVNVASRLESLAEPGGICVSESIEKATRGQSIQTLDLGEFDLKNVDYRVKAYAIQGVGLPTPARKKSNKSALARRYYVGIAAVMIAVIAIGLYFYSQPEATFSNERMTPDMKSIAVIPFANLSLDPEQEYFSLGITEAILNNLVKIPNIGVISRTTMMQYKETELSVTTISKEVNARYIVEGSVQKSSSEVRITVQLIDGSTDLHLWSNSYDRELKDIFEVQSEVALEIAKNLELHLSPKTQEQIKKIGTQNVEAYDLVLKVKDEYRIGWDINFNDSLEIARLEEAILLDPSYSEPYALMGDNYLFRAGVVGRSNPREIAAKGKMYLETALKLDPNNGFAHMVKGNHDLWIEWNFAEAEKNYNRAIELEPSDINVLSNINDLYLATGRADQAIQGLLSVIEIEPFPVFFAYLALAHAFAGADNETIERATQRAFRGKRSTNLYSESARAHLVAGNYPRVIEILNEYPRTQDIPRTMGMLAIAKYKTGDTLDYPELLEKLIQWSTKTAGGSPSFYIAMVYASMNDVDKAYEWLDKSYQDHEVEMYWLKVEPEFKTLHKDPRWQEMLDKVGFPK